MQHKLCTSFWAWLPGVAHAGQIESNIRDSNLQLINLKYGNIATVTSDVSQLTRIALAILAYSGQHCWLSLYDVVSSFGVIWLCYKWNTYSEDFLKLGGLLEITLSRSHLPISPLSNFVWPLQICVSSTKLIFSL